LEKSASPLALEQRDQLVPTLVEEFLKREKREGANDRFCLDIETVLERTFALQKYGQIGIADYNTGMAGRSVISSNFCPS
jgi:hypothetical protein